MTIRGWSAGLVVAVSCGAAANAIDAVHPGGPGVLTKCRGWVVARSCRTYQHISLPSRIAVSDKIPISFGTHPKEFEFFVARIALKGERCTLFSDATGERHRRDKISITPCYPAGPAP